MQNNTLVLQADSRRPWVYVRDLDKISTESHVLKGIDYLVVDWDGTLCDTKDNLSMINAGAIKEWIHLGYIKGFVIITNSVFARKAKKERGIRAILAKVGLTPMAVICLGRRNRKPKPDGFQAALVALRCTKDKVLMIGDQLVSDIQGANRLGWKTVLVDHFGGYMLANILSGRTWRNRKTMRKLQLVPQVYWR